MNYDPVLHRKERGNIDFFAARKAVFVEDTVYNLGYALVQKFISKRPQVFEGVNLEESAIYRMSKRQKIFVLCFVVSYIGALALNWHIIFLLTASALTVMYFADLLLNMFLIYRSFAKSPEIKISDQEIDAVEESQWPTYTIFCPLYKEWQVVPQFVAAMKNLDYPVEKLQIMFLLEEDDKETIDKVNSYALPPNFDIVVVPHSLPKTKPKACNYGLNRASGEYVVIYDAEDIPDAKQLKKAVLAFRKSNSRIFCIQAKLNFYNPYQNFLTRLFTAEYSLWFDLVLTGLQSINGPIPLGGTSNHFRTRDLRRLSGWDPFNVTEDCDLGVRMIKRGYRTAIMDSTTLEEANSDVKNWMHQRSRWIKGYIQTYLVHMRRPLALWKGWREPHLLTFQLVVGGKILSMFINPLLWLVTIVYFAFRATAGPVIESFYPDYILHIGVFSLVFGNFFYMYNYMIACAKRGLYPLIKYVYLVPFYWLMMSTAAWLALYDMIRRPHYWAKTMHGLHLGSVAVNAPAANVAVKKEVAEKKFSPLEPALELGMQSDSEKRAHLIRLRF